MIYDKDLIQQGLCEGCSEGEPSTTIWALIITNTIMGVPYCSFEKWARKPYSNC